MVTGTTILQVGSHATTALKVQNFYKKNPFPNFDDYASLTDLDEVRRSNDFLRIFKDQLGLGKKIIEVGSGTSQLSVVLSFGTNNQVTAFDATLESLQLGEVFARKYNLPNCNFVLGDIFSDPFEDGYFDCVWCSGALHHTDDPQGGFDIISKWLKKNGIIVVGLYSKFGRLKTKSRQLIFKCLGSSMWAKRIVYFLDPIIRSQTSKLKKEVWFQDQYLHPVESTHTLTEVLKWFDLMGIEFVSSVPSCTTEKVNMNDIFKKQSRGSFLSRMISEFLFLFGTGGLEGGLFLVIGRKK